MPTLTSGNSVTLPIGAADSITIDTLQGATCVVEYPVGTRIAAFSGQRTLGPFTGSSALISVSGGDLYYEFADGSGPSLPVEYDAATGSFRAGGSPVSGAGIAVKQAYRAGATVGTVIATGADGISGGAGHWSVTNGTLSTVTDPTRPGRTILRITGATGAGSTVVRKKITSTPLTGKFEVVAKTPAVSAGTPAFWIGFSATAPSADPPTAAPAGNRQLYTSGITDSPFGIWQNFTAHPSSPRYSTTSVNGRAWSSTETLPSVVQYLEIILQYDANVPDAEKILDIDEVRINGYAKPMVVYTFDGAGQYAAINSYVLPLFRSLGLVGVISGSAATMQANKARIDELYAAGWDVVHQALRSTNNYGTTPKDLWSDITRASAIMRANGWTRDGMDVLMTMPSNSRTPTTDAIAADRGIQLVGASGGLIGHSCLPHPGKLGIGRFSINGVTAAQADAFRNAAILEGSSLVYFGHDMVTSVTDGSTQMLQSEFTPHATATAAAIANGQCENVTLSELNRRL